MALTSGSCTTSVTIHGLEPLFASLRAADHDLHGRTLDLTYSAMPTFGHVQATKGTHALGRTQQHTGDIVMLRSTSYEPVNVDQDAIQQHRRTQHYA